MKTTVRSLLGLLALMLPLMAAGQTTLGELLDAGGKRVSIEEFKRDVVQRALVGPSPTGGTFEIVYTSGGTIQGLGTPPLAPQSLIQTAQVLGEWSMDESGKACASLRIVPPSGPPTILPSRCQFWFKLGDAYFVSDSDKDRGAKIVKRMPKAPPASLAAGPNNLGELLDAGARKLSAEEFKRDIVQRTVIGSLPTGGPMEMMYATNGIIAGVGANPIDTPASYRNRNPLTGAWSIGEGDRVCTTLQISPTTGTVTTVPRRCESWFKLGDAYFVSDSDKDRGARVLKRTLQPSPVAPLAEPRNLGELLDAGARKVSSQEFKRDVVQRTIVGPTTAGGEIEVMYVANGTIQGRRSTQMVGSQPYPNPAPVAGEWEVDQTERVCDAMRITPTYGATMSLPARCQFWFKLGDTYFISDSDSDRRASVLRRILQR